MNNQMIIEKVMNLLLNGDSKVLQQLKVQYDHSKITSIKETGKGLFVDFEVLDSNLKLNIDGVKEKFVFGDVFGEINETYGTVEFILFVRNGFITMLEGFTYFPDGWNQVTSSITFQYFNDGRDEKKLEAGWL